MIDYRLFYPKMSIDDEARARRPRKGHAARRVYRLPERQTVRNGGRR